MFYKQYLLTLREMHCFLFTSCDLFLFHIFKNWFHETSVGQLWRGSGSTLLWWGGVFYHWHCWELLAHDGNKKRPIVTLPVWLLFLTSIDSVLFLRLYQSCLCPLDRPWYTSGSTVWKTNILLCIELLKLVIYWTSTKNQNAYVQLLCGIFK